MTKLLKYITGFFLLLTMLAPARAQSKAEVEILYNLQEILRGSDLKTKIDAFHAVSNVSVYPMFHLEDDSALLPYVIELYFSVRIERKEPYVIATLDFKPKGSSLTDFNNYGISIKLSQGKQQALSPALLAKAETEINKVLVNVKSVGSELATIKKKVEGLIDQLRALKYQNIHVQLPLVDFYPVTGAQGSQYGYDRLRYPALQSEYTTFRRYDSTVVVPFKAMSTSSLDKFKAVVTRGDTSTRPANIRYRNDAGVQVMPTENPADTVAIFSLTGSSGDNEFTAYYPLADSTGKETEVPIGRIKLRGYEPTKKNLVLVPLSTAKRPAGTISNTTLQTYLNQVYQQANIQWTVTMGNGWDPSTSVWDTDGNDTLNIESGLFSRYSGELTKLLGEFETKYKPTPETYYLFITNAPNDRRYEGYMPLNGDYGFIFTAAMAPAGYYERTIAHELGHGAFGLEHMWKKYALTQNTTANLMDYNNGTELWAGQWEYMHSWHIPLDIGMSEDDAAVTASINMKCLSETDARKLKTSVFYDLKGNPIDIGKDGIPVAFSAASEKAENFPGSITRFVINNKLYLATHSGSQFVDYSVQEGTSIVGKYTYPTIQNGIYPSKVLIDEDGNVFINKNTNDVADFTTNNCPCNNTKVTRETLLKLLTWHEGAFPSDPRNVKYLTPSGLPIEIPGNWQVLVLKKASTYPYLPLTMCIYGFRKESDKAVYVATFNDLIFKGFNNEGNETYKSLLNNQRHYDDVFEKDEPNPHYHFYYYNSIDDKLPYLYYCKDITIDAQYTSEGALLSKMDYCYNGCKQSICENEKIQNVSFTQLFNNSVSFSYNYDGNGGTLSEYVLNDKTFYIYARRIGDNQWEYYKYNVASITCCEKWVRFDYPYPNVHEQLKLLVDKTGHGTLDAIGIIPGFGEFADLLNGTWYLFENENGEAALCYASMLPIVGDVAVKGGKYSIKCIKGLSKLDKEIALSQEASSTFVTIARKLNDGNSIHLQSCLFETAKFLTKNDKYYSVIERLATEVNDAEKLEKIFTRLHELDATKQAAFLEDLLVKASDDANSLSKNLSKIDEGLVESWKMLQDAPNVVRRNSNILDGVTKLRGKTLPNGEALDVQKLFDNGFRNTLSNCSDADKTKILVRLNEWDAGKIDDLGRRLGKDNYPKLADDIVNPEFFKLYDDIIHDPENAIDLAKRAGDGNLLTTAKSTFFNIVTKLGKDFETVVSPALNPGGALRDKLKTLLKDKFGVDDLDSYAMFEQVQLTYNKTTGDYFVADQVFVKYKTMAGQKVVDDIIVIENKLSEVTRLTENQFTAKGLSDYYSKGDKLGIPRESPVSFKGGNIKWIRAYGNGDGKTIVDLTEIFK